MIIPRLNAELTRNDFFVYAACDETYFDEFAVPFINSARKNTTRSIHLHLFNPRKDQIQYCKNKDISVSYENAPLDLFQKAADKWLHLDGEHKRQILEAMAKSGDKEIVNRIQKTYFACARFIRLNEIIASPRRLFAIDVDAVVRNEIPLLDSNCDLYIHKNRQFLAGGIYLTGTTTSQKFLREYATCLIDSITKDNLYWTLDQDILDKLVPNYIYSELPRSLIDWGMQDTSCIWTAKGKRKELTIFKQEQQKYRN